MVEVEMTLKQRLVLALMFGINGGTSGAGVGAIGFLFTKKIKNVWTGVKYGTGIGAVLGFIPELWAWAVPEPWWPPPETGLTTQSFEDPYHADLIRID